MTYTHKLDEAVALALDLHRAQTRKGTDIPYATHLFAVTALVGENGGGESELIAAVLHDAAEDQGGESTLELIRERFGHAVADIVAGCSDTFDDPKPPWRQRKEAYLARLERASPSVLLVSAADKLHNARATLVDLETTGPSVWERFSAGRDGTLWYYRALLDVYERRLPSPLSHQLGQVVAALHDVAGVDPATCR